jgi:hypothetical protein
MAALDSDFPTIFGEVVDVVGSSCAKNENCRAFIA